MKKDNLIDWFTILEKIIRYDIAEHMHEKLFFEYKESETQSIIHAKVTLYYNHKEVFHYRFGKPIGYDKELLKSEASLGAINAFIVYNAKEMIKNNQQ